jgi:hypothetical protein
MSDELSLRMDPPSSGVKVRMYRVGGLGDCFLLAFRTRSRRARYMLIDCGVFLGTKDGSKQLQAVARDIQAATGGRLHVLVATHEHWDHLSGFKYARKIFDQMQIDEAWLAWTESPGHPLAERLRKRREITLRALDTALHQLRAMDHPLAARLEGVLSFHDFLSADTKLTGSAGLMKYVQQVARNTRYLTPTQPPLTWPDVSGVRVFVLGPPEDEKLLSRSDPSGLEGEVYERPEALNSAAAFYASVLAGGDPTKLSSTEQDMFNRSLPFDPVHGIRIPEASQHSEFAGFFQQTYGFSDAQEGSQGPEWRRIDMDWWGQVENLALHLDNDTNNTSLALAIELPGGKVLLFPGDAQVGNWLSWQNLSWPEDKGEPVTVAGLLHRTVLYKVGHHGSHNATLRDKGLELMTRPDLTAMIPVYRSAAEQRGWAMPFPSLLERLKEKTRGRVLYSDPNLPSQDETVTPEQWDIANCCVNVDPSGDDLWIELVIETRESADLEPPPAVKTAAKPAQAPKKPRPAPPLTKKRTPE